MAYKGIGFFDNRGHFYKTPEDATCSDLAMLLGRIGEGDSLAPGIATLLLERRCDIERIFADHSAMKDDQAAYLAATNPQATNVTPLTGKLAS